MPSSTRILPLFLPREGIIRLGVCTVNLQKKHHREEGLNRKTKSEQTKSNRIWTLFTRHEKILIYWICKWWTLLFGKSSMRRPIIHMLTQLWQRDKGQPQDISSDKHRVHKAGYRRGKKLCLSFEPQYKNSCYLLILCITLPPYGE